MCEGPWVAERLIDSEGSEVFLTRAAKQLSGCHGAASFQSMSKRAKRPMFSAQTG